MIHYFYGTLQVGIGQTLCSFEHVSCFYKSDASTVHGHGNLVPILHRFGYIAGFLCS